MHFTRYHDIEKYLYEVYTLVYPRSRRPPQIRWGTGLRRKALRKIQSITLGTFDYDTDTITMNPALDQRWVSRKFIKLTIYHELLHRKMPPDSNRGKLQFHTTAFKEAEAKYPGYTSIVAWERRNINKLIESQKNMGL